MLPLLKVARSFRRLLSKLIGRSWCRTGIYVFASDFWRLEGVRKQITLQHIVLSVETGDRLDAAQSDRLVDTAGQLGKSLDLFEFRSVYDTLTRAFRKCDEMIQAGFLEELAAFEADNEVRVAQARQLVESRAARKLDRAAAILDQQKNSDDERRETGPSLSQKHGSVR